MPLLQENRNPRSAVPDSRDPRHNRRMQETIPFDGKAFVANLSSAPGVYRMLGAAGDAAVCRQGRQSEEARRQLFPQAAHAAAHRRHGRADRADRNHPHAHRGRGLAARSATDQKSLNPRYNILLRDDKSYPYIHLTAGDYPRLAFHRGARTGGGRYFGPYPSAISVRETLSLMQKLFRIRNCEDSYFKNRSRPCLQYQIGRCSAPCVGLISAEDYQKSVRHAVMFLEGNSNALLDELIAGDGARQRSSSISSVPR